MTRCATATSRSRSFHQPSSIQKESASMAEIFQSKAAFGEHLSQLALADSAGVIVRERADDALAIVTARRGMAAELAKRVNAMGIVLPSGPRREAQGSLAFLGIGPGR